ncbi:hypothetical protein L596_028053 [Steinernema carpocapsae]|uniref:Uncharacterized protein n=1 Tax=Steinernema carpocapsae TaxID=34508 RepID=A0A4U5LXD6_STECR|nr:hypothetical protein L596_028053 [Steinernema carpocapsae]
MASTAKTRPRKDDTKTLFHLVVFSHFTLAYSIFLLAAVGYAATYKPLLPVTNLSLVQAASSVPGLIYAYRSSPAVLAVFLTFQLLVGTSEFCFAIFSFVNGDVANGIGLIVMVPVQALLVFLAFYRPTNFHIPQLAKKMTESLFHKSEYVTPQITSLASVSVSSVQTAKRPRNKQKRRSNDKPSVRTTSPSIRSLPRSDMATSNLQLSKEIVNENKKNGTQSTERATQREKKPPADLPEKEAISESRICDEALSLQQLANTAALPVILERDLSNSIEQYLFEDCVRSSLKHEAQVSSATATSPKAADGKTASDSYKLIEMAKQMPNKEVVGKTPYATPLAAKVDLKDTKITKHEKRKFTEDVSSLTNSSEGSERKQRWQFVPKKNVVCKDEFP